MKKNLKDKKSLNIAISKFWKKSPMYTAVRDAV